MGLKRQMLITLAGTVPGFWAGKLQNPIFILGCGRSGTTLLNELLTKHADVAVLSEANDIWDPSGYPWSRSPQASPPIWLDAEAYTSRWWQDNRARQHEIRAIFGAFQAIQRKPVFLNKTPLNTFRIPYLLETFPQARFINIVRDGRAVVYSYAHKQMQDIQRHPAAYAHLDLAQTEEALTVQLAKFWQENILEVNHQDQSLNLETQGQLLTVTYEALCHDLRASLILICQFMNIDPDRFQPEVWQTSVQSQNHKWRSAWSSSLQTQVIQQMQLALDQTGYE
jgi:hypothetical protein